MTQETSSSKKPGAMALETMKQVNEIATFKLPTSIVPKSKATRKKAVLDEETYIQEMSSIIEKDFFPDLEKLKAQNDYLEAVEKNDVQRLRELYMKYSSGRPPTERYASPATFETPTDLRREDDPPDKVTSEKDAGVKEGGKADIENNKPENHRSLDAYLQSYTSEDNQSFQEIMEVAERKHREKFSWLYAAEDQSKLEQKEMLALPSIEQQATCDERPLMVNTWAYKNKNYIMYIPEGQPLSAEEQVEMARRRQEIVHSNTRLARNPFDERQNKETIQQLWQSQAQSSLEGRIGVDGKELSQGPPRDYVATPSPAPGVNESPLMTWGHIEGTPFRLDGGDTPVRSTPGPSFRIPEQSRRERLALALAEQAGERHRGRKLKAMEAARRQLATPSPRPSSGASLERLSSMSPAARRLASARIRLGSDRALLSSYSPRAPTTKVSTPRRSPRSTPKTPALNITDDLLQLPQRKRASDFF